jgi:hypothetical protein
VDTVVDVTAGTAILSATTGIGSVNALETMVDVLDASVTGTGNMVIVETDGVTLRDVDTANGSINITSGGDTVVTDVESVTDSEANDIWLTATRGDITVQRVTAGGVNADVTMTAANGSILDAAPDTAADRVIGDVVTLVAGNGIGAGDGNGPVQTQAVSLNMHVTTDGSMFVDEADAVTLRDVDTQDGSIRITTGGNTTVLDVASLIDSVDNDISIIASNGSINVSTVNAQSKGGVDIEATNGAVVDDSNDGTVITGNDVAITANTGIGAEGNEIDTTAGSLDLSVTGAGNIHINETDGVTLKDVDTANGSIDIRTGGDTFVTDVESVTDADANDITINATNGSITVQRINGGGVASDVNVISVKGSILDAPSDTTEDRIIADEVTLIAARGVGAGEGAGGEGSVATEAKTLNVSVSGNGSIFLAEVDSVNLALVQTQNGSITVSTGGDTIATNVTSLTDTDANDISLTVGAGSLNVVVVNAGGTNGDVSLTATEGGINDDTNDTTRVSADVLRMTAGAGIGANDELDTTVRTLGLARVTGTGSIAINETDSLTLDSGDAQVNDVVVTNYGDFTLGAGVNAVVNDNIAVAGDVDMSNVTVDIRINRNLRISGDGMVNLRSDAGGTLVGDADGTTETLTISTGTPVAGGAGQILLGNVGRPGEYVSLSFVPTGVENPNFDDPQNENVINLRLDGTMQFDASGFDARNVRQVILDGDTSISTINADVLFTHTPIEAAAAGNQTLTINAGRGIVDFYIVGCTEYLDGSPINVTDAVPLGGLNVTARLVRLAGNVCTNDGAGGGNITIVADSVDLLTNLTITSDADDSGTGGAINFLDAPINGNYEIVVDSGNASISLTDIGQTTRVGSVTVRTTGNVTLGDGPTAISTVNDINFTGAMNVVLGGNLTADSAQGDILLNGGNVDGAVDVNLTALQGTVKLFNFGQMTALNSLALAAASAELSGRETAMGHVTFDLSQSFVNRAVLTSRNGDVRVTLDNTGTGFAHLLEGSLIRADNGRILFNVPFRNLQTRGDLMAPNQHEFFNLLGLPSYQFDAEETAVARIPRALFDAFWREPVMFGQFLYEEVQWRQTILPLENFVIRASKVKFEDEEASEDEE